MCFAIPGCTEQLVAEGSSIVNPGGVRKEASLALFAEIGGVAQE